MKWRKRYIVNVKEKDGLWSEEEKAEGYIVGGWVKRTIRRTQMESVQLRILENVDDDTKNQRAYDDSGMVARFEDEKRT